MHFLGLKYSSKGNRFFLSFFSFTLYQKGGTWYPEGMDSKFIINNNFFYNWMLFQCQSFVFGTEISKVLSLSKKEKFTPGDMEPPFVAMHLHLFFLSWSSPAFNRLNQDHARVNHMLVSIALVQSRKTSLTFPSIPISSKTALSLRNFHGHSLTMQAPPPSPDLHPPALHQRT